MSKSCDTCDFFLRIKNRKGWEGRIGICGYADCSLKKIIKNCDDHMGKKYKRRVNK